MHRARARTPGRDRRPVASHRHQRSESERAARMDQGIRRVRSRRHDAAVPVVRLQARHSARCRPGVRRALPAQSVLRSAAAAADGKRPRGGRLPGGRREREAHVRRHPQLRRNLAAGFRRRQPQLRDGRDRLHRRRAPFGVFRRRRLPVISAARGACWCATANCRHDRRRRLTANPIRRGHTSSRSTRCCFRAACCRSRFSSSAISR